jgi:BirA family transcriptional regulator, biotin operon repressor / biotin---[acetyl-CoA-carboxylase] ligase
MIGQNIIRFPVLDSTNRHLSELISGKRPSEGTVIHAAFQTAGRGMDKNRWESAPGQNLTFSIVLYPTFLPADRQFSLNKAISLALTDCVGNLPGIGKGLKIKWPNDIYIDDRKLAGMLIQNGVKGDRFDYCIIGIGLNVNQENFGNYPVKPVSLKMATGNSFDPDELLPLLLGSLENRYKQLQNGDIPSIDKDYTGILYRFGEYHDYFFQEKLIHARITGVNHYGQLVLEKKDGGIVECDLKEVRFI